MGCSFIPSQLLDQGHKNKCVRLNFNEPNYNILYLYHTTYYTANEHPIQVPTAECLIKDVVPVKRGIQISQ